MNKSLWLDTSTGKRFDKLSSNIRTDYLIVGGGIAGVTTAYLLSQKGMKVTLIDADYLGHGATGNNTGKVTAQHNIIYSKIVKDYGINVAKEYYESNLKAIELIESIIDKHGIDCDYERAASYIFAQGEEGSEELLKEFNVCKELGIKCEFTMEIPLPIEIKGAIKFNFAGQFNPKKYIDALILEIEKFGVEIYEKTSATGIDVFDGEPHKVKTLDGYIIEAEKIIICSHFPFYDGLSFYFTRLRAERSYLVAGEYPKAFPKATFISVDKPKRSIRHYDDGKRSLLLLGGENHKVGHDNEKDYYKNLKEYGKEIFSIENYSYQWSAQDYIPPDYMPYIGYINSVKENLYVATGFAKWGITNGTVAAIMLSELSTTNNCEYKETFTPSRKEGYYNLQFYKENLDGSIQYITGKLKGSSKDMPNKGEGKTVKIDKKKYGAFRDEKGILHIVDIKCTHLGCELKWNPLEKSWDCPCHGSRFSIDGNILEGPATLPLNGYGAEESNQINPNLL